MPNRIPLAFIPFFIAGVALSFWVRLRIATPWWVVILAGLAIVAVGIWLLIPAWRDPVDTSLRAAAGFLITYTGLSVVANTWWPILLMVPALAAVIRWRAVRIQTGHRQP